jgi:hypothetical protein
MSGDERSRHCASCDKPVFNIAGMTGAEAEALLRTATGGHGLCVRFYRRADGTVMTADCPVGIAALRAKARRTAVRIAAAVGLTSLVSWAAAQQEAAPFATARPLSVIAQALRGQPVQPVTRVITMGSVCPTPPAQPSSGDGDAR